jgi:hypothetical protein
MKRQLILYILGCRNSDEHDSFKPSSPSTNKKLATCKGENPCRACNEL